MYGPGYAAARAEVLARLGRLEESLSEVERLLSVPAGLTVHRCGSTPVGLPGVGTPASRRSPALT